MPFAILLLLLILGALQPRSVLAVEITSQSPVSSDNSQQESMMSVDEKISAIDFEISLLKAELALQNGDYNYINNYLAQQSKVKKMAKQPIALTPSVLARIQRLKEALLFETNERQYSIQEASVFQPSLAKIVVLLPTTGEFEDLGNAVKEGLFEALQDYDVSYFDTNLYTNMAELWNVVKLYQPTLIIGPLQKEHVEALNQLNIGVPTLYLNSESNPNAYTRSLSLSRDSGIDSLIQHLVENDVQSIAVLSDTTEKSSWQQAIFKQKWEQQQKKTILKAADLELETPEFQSLYFQTESSMDKTMQKVLNQRKSLSRKNWLQHTIGSELFFKERVRQDIEVFIAFLDQNQALQLTPMLQYFDLNYVEDIWLPSRLPKSKELINNLSYWRNTLAIFPQYYTSYIQEKLSGSAKNMSSFEARDKKIGTFYALGNLAAEVVKKLSRKDTSAIPSALGLVEFDEDQRPVIRPELVWLNKGEMHSQK